MESTPKARFILEGDLPEGLKGKVPRQYEIHVSHAEKLRRLFFEANVAGGPTCSSSASASFEVQAWVLLTRYQALFGPHDEGAGWHMALMPQVVNSLMQDFGVAHELFASPLNCAFPSYCSLFLDTDGWFGSQGSFFPFCREVMVSKGGSFECNPPFEEHLLRLVVHTLLETLRVCSQPLLVALVVPHWPQSEALAVAVKDPHCRARVDISGSRHAYLNGRQHCCQSRHRVLRQTESRGSVVVFLQNDAGALKWRISENCLERHRKAWGQHS